MKTEEPASEFLPYHPQASHVDPDYRDGWNACYKLAAIEIERLTKQVNAYKQLTESQEKRITHLAQARDGWVEATTSLQSERDANAILTTKVEALESELRTAAVLMQQRDAENDALRADAGRIDLIEGHINQHGSIYFHDGNNPRGIGIGLRPGNLVCTLRQAIDAAMKQGETPC